MGLKALGKRSFGELYILPTENNAYYKARNFNGKRYMYHHIYLSRSAADVAAEAHRARGRLARVIPGMIWVNKAGYEYGIQRMQGYVLYVHMGGDNKRCQCGSGKSPFTFEGKKRCADCAPIFVGD